MCVYMCICTLPCTPTLFHVIWIKHAKYRHNNLLKNNIVYSYSMKVLEMCEQFSPQPQCLEDGMTLVLLMFRFPEFKFRGSFYQVRQRTHFHLRETYIWKLYAYLGGICLWIMKREKKITLQICMHVLFLVLEIIWVF